MPFPLTDRKFMLMVPGIGPAVIQRLEAAGIHSLTELAHVGPDKAVGRVCAQLGTCAWENRRKALLTALRLAELQLPQEG